MPRSADVTDFIAVLLRGYTHILSQGLLQVCHRIVRIKQSVAKFLFRPSAKNIAKFHSGFKVVCYNKFEKIALM